MQLRNYLTHLKECPHSIILGALYHISANYPSISELLTGGLVPEDSIIKLIEGLSEVVPIISVQGGTYAVTNSIGRYKIADLCREHAEDSNICKGL
jgi:phosphate acetyltransferase